MRHFAKGFLIGTLCICLLGLVWLFAFQPRLTAQEAQDLKTQFTTIPTDDLSGDGPAGKEEPQLDFKALQTRYPDVKGWLTIPGTVVDYPVMQSSAQDPEQYLFNRTQFAGDEDFLSFAGSMLAGTGYTAQAGDRLLTLVTCAYTWDGARTVVVAVEQN